MRLDRRLGHRVEVRLTWLRRRQTHTLSVTITNAMPRRLPAPTGCRAPASLIVAALQPRLLGTVYCDDAALPGHNPHAVAGGQIAVEIMVLAKDSACLAGSDADQDLVRTLLIGSTDPA